MSSIKLSPNASGTGIFSIEAPNSSTNRTLTLPDQTGTVLTNAGPFTANASASNGAVTIDASNNVGIGTGSPSTKLHVQGVARSANSGNTVYTELQNDGVYATGTDLYLLAPSGKFLAMYAGNAERARIDSSGNLLVNTTSQNDSGQFSLTVASGRNGIGISVGSTAETGQIIFRNPNGVVGRVYTTNSTTTYATSSDYRLKEDVQPMVGALAKISALKPCTYKWKVDGTDGQGFIAHELQEIVPECVSGQKDAVDEEGNIVPQGIDTSFLVATLTAALQELNAKVEAQAAEIAALKGAK